jgi:hypothetical protein
MSARILPRVGLRLTCHCPRIRSVSPLGLKLGASGLSMRSQRRALACLIRSVGGSNATYDDRTKITACHGGNLTQFGVVAQVQARRAK